MNHDDELTSRLTRTLTDHSEAMAGSSFGLADVKGRARSIRRRRTATAIAGAAAAVAILVPTVALASHTSGRPEPGPATQTPTPTLTPSQTAAPDSGHQPEPGVLDVSDLPTGNGPALDYLQNGVLHFADGGTGKVNTRFTPMAFVDLDDGARVWQTSDQGTPYVEIQDADGTFHPPVRSDFGLSVNPSHSVVAWLEPTGQVVVWEGRANDPKPLGEPVPGAELRPGPITGDRCALACSVVVNAIDAQGHRLPWEVTPSGTQRLRDGSYLTVNDVNESGLSIGVTELTDFGSCSKLLGGGEFQGFGTCRNQLQSFSPDGRLILALPAYFDGAGPGGIAMYDAQGTRLFERTATRQVQSYFTGATWEDDTHVLAPTYQDGTWALVRIGSDGTMEYAVPPASGPYEESPFILPTGGMLPVG